MVGALLINAALLIDAWVFFIFTAGIPLQKCAGSETSVYTGSFTDDYSKVMMRDSELKHRYAAMGVAWSML